MFLRHLVRWPSADLQVKFYGDRPRGTPPSGELNTRGVPEYSDFDPSNAISRKRCKIGVKFVLITNRKSHIDCLEHKGDMSSFWSFGLFVAKSLLAKPFRCTKIFSYFLLFSGERADTLW